MVIINDKEFRIYDLDTMESFVCRLASLMKTLPKYVYFIQGLPSMNDIMDKGTKINVEDVLDEIRKSAHQNIRFSKFFEKNREKIQGLNIADDVLKPYMAFNDELSQIDKEYIDTVLLDLSENIKSVVDIENVYNVVRDAWQNRTKIIAFIKKKIEENRDEAEENLKDFAQFDDVKVGTIAHSDFIVEKVAFGFNLNGFSNNNLMEIFNDIITTPSIPFVSCKNFFKISRDKVPRDEWIESQDDLILMRLRQNIMNDTNNGDYAVVVVNIEEEIVSAKLQIDIGKNNINESRAVNDIVNVFATDGIVANNVKQNFISGVFYMANQRMNNYVFSDLVMNNSLFSNILAINENVKTSKRKSGLYVHFNFLTSGYLAANITEKIVIRSDYYQDNMNKNMFQLGTPYVRVKITRTDSMDTVNKFIDMICKLFSIYNREHDKIVKIYREYIPHFAEDEKKPIEQVAEEREQNLRDIAPEIFHPNYSRKCIYKPVVVSEDELDKYKDRQVIKFPKDDKATQPRYYMCNHKKHKYVGLRDNPFDNKDKFPYIPCCYIKNQEMIEGSEFRQYYYDEEPIRREIKQQHILTTDKFVLNGAFGTLPRNIDALFNLSGGDSKYIHLRRGVERSPSSFLQCVMGAIGMAEAKNLNVVLEQRHMLSNENFASSCRQEMYDRTADEIMNEMINADAFMSPRKYMHGLETYFDCNIFLFTRDSAGGELTVPDHLQAYYRNKNDRKCVFILEHMGSESDNAKYPQCEIICRWNSENETDVKCVFKNDDNVSRLVERVFDEISSYYLLDKPLEKLIANFNYKIIGQTIDSYGKTRMIYIYHGNNPISLLTSPIPPLNVKEIDNSEPVLIDINDALRFIYDTKMELIGRNVRNGINMIVCMTGNISMAIPVRYSENLQKLKLVKSDLMCVNFTDSLLNHHIMGKKYARYFTEYLFWLFSQYLDAHDILYEENAINSIDEFVNENITIDSNFEFGNVAKFFSFDSGILRDKKLVVTSKEILLRLIFVLKLKIHRDFAELVNYHKRNVIESYYINASDFTHHWQQIVLESKNSVIEWINNRIVKYTMYDEVNDECQYFFRNTAISKNVFLVKNVKTLDEALHVCLMWKNEGYVPCDVVDDIIDIEFTLFVYKNRTNIDRYVVRGKRNTHGAKVLAYRTNSGESKFAALMDV